MLSGRELVLVTAWLFGLALAPVAAAEPEHGFVERTYRAADGQEYKYVLFVPYAYQGDKPFPLIVFLHGSGETGRDGQKPVRIGIGRAVRDQEKTFPFFVFFPQGLRPNWDADTRDSQRAIAILDEVQKDYRVDVRRVCVTGLSSGGDGTFSWAAKYPERWAAIVPICGVGDPSIAAKIKDIPCWCFEGAWYNPDDMKTVHALMAAVWDLGGKPGSTEYPNLTHYCWDPTYAKPEVYDWLLQQRRK